MKPKVFKTASDVRLHSMTSTNFVWWSHRCNSYVLCEGSERSHFTLDGRKVNLYSVNGIGEVRWDVMAHSIESGLRLEAQGKLDPSYDSAEQLEAARYFGLSYDGKKL